MKNKIEDLKWDKFNKFNWLRLLIARPEFADKCDNWHKFDDEDWAELLLAQPELIKYKN